MRKITVISMVSLDGVMQAPGGPEEDKSNGFQYGGWTAAYTDELFGKLMQEELSQPVDYLLGRKTFDIWEPYWPKHGDFWPGINKGKKYVVSETRNNSDWKDSEFIQTLEDIKKLKNSEGPDLQVWGSSELVQLLLEHDLVDDLRLKIYPLTLGAGKRIFHNASIATAFKLIENVVTTTGVIIAHYQLAGKVKTGNVAP